jgi:hypothetical protein
MEHIIYLSSDWVALQRLEAINLRAWIKSITTIDRWANFEFSSRPKLRPTPHVTDRPKCKETVPDNRIPQFPVLEKIGIFTWLGRIISVLSGMLQGPNRCDHRRFRPCHGGNGSRCPLNHASQANGLVLVFSTRWGPLLWMGEKWEMSSSVLFIDATVVFGGDRQGLLVRK